MSFVVRLRHVVMGATVALAALPASVAAQELATVSLPTSSTFELVPSSSLQSAALASSFAAAQMSPLQPSLPAAKTNSRGVLVPLYVSFATLQMLDAHSTLRAIDGGASEQNVMLQGIADKPVALVALKSGVAAGTILLTERLRRHSRLGAIVTMVALNSVYATVVAHNYNVGH